MKIRCKEMHIPLDMLSSFHNYIKFVKSGASSYASFWIYGSAGLFRVCCERNGQCGLGIMNGCASV